MKTQLSARLPPLFYLATLVGLVILADNGALDTRWILGLPWGDKVCHFLLMGLGAAAMNRILGHRTLALGSWRPGWGTVLLLVAVTLEEGSQAFIASRTCSAGDLLADYLGVVCFCGLAPRWRRASGGRTTPPGGRRAAAQGGAARAGQDQRGRSSTTVPLR